MVFRPRDRGVDAGTVRRGREASERRWAAAGTGSERRAGDSTRSAAGISATATAGAGAVAIARWSATTCKPHGSSCWRRTCWTSCESATACTSAKTTTSSVGKPRDDQPRSPVFIGYRPASTATSTPIPGGVPGFGGLPAVEVITMRPTGPSVRTNERAPLHRPPVTRPLFSGTRPRPPRSDTGTHGGVGSDLLGILGGRGARTEHPVLRRRRRRATHSLRCTRIAGSPAR